MKKRIFTVLLIATIFTIFCSCGAKNDDNQGRYDDKENVDRGTNDTSIKANEDYFEWDGNLITGISAEGSKQNSIIIPARCEGFSGVIFQETKIESVAFEDDDDIALDFAFMGAENIVSVELPANLTTIPSMCFKTCKKLKSISIPDSVSMMGSYAFSACAELTDVVFEGENIKVISENCFENCTVLNSVIIPYGVTTIEKYAFFDCVSLENVTFNPTVSTFAKFAFGNTGIKEIHLPSEVTIALMDESAFGTNAYTATVYITQDSWCDKNQSSWDIGFGEIKYE